MHEGAKKTYVKRLIGKEVGANKFFMRCYFVESGGCTPPDRHNYEHEVFVLKGKGVLVGEGFETEIKEDDCIFIACNEFHQFKNVDKEPLVFVCVRGADELYK